MCPALGSASPGMPCPGDRPETPLHLPDPETEWVPFGVHPQLSLASQCTPICAILTLAGHGVGSPS